MGSPQTPCRPATAKAEQGRFRFRTLRSQMRKAAGSHPRRLQAGSLGTSDRSD